MTLIVEYLQCVILFPPKHIDSTFPNSSEQRRGCWSQILSESWKPLVIGWVHFFMKFPPGHIYGTVVNVPETFDATSLISTTGGGSDITTCLPGSPNIETVRWYMVSVC